MKKYLAVIGVLVMVGSAVNAISSGPGGRIYMTGDQGAVGILSIKIDSNWDPIGVPAAAQESHGTVTNARTSNGTGISPEIEHTGGGSAGYADLVMGLWYNNDPACVYTPSSQTMDVVRVVPSNGSNAVTVLGDGKPSQQTGWYNLTSSPNYNTERGWCALPDPVGGFTGTGVYASTQEDYYFTTRLDRYGVDHINYDHFGDDDCTDNDEDYVANSIQGGESGGSVYYGAMDTEIYQNYLYVPSGYIGAIAAQSGYPRVEIGGIRRMTATQDGDGRTTDLTPDIWYTESRARPGVEGGLIVVKYGQSGGGAAGQVEDPDGGLHDTAWVSYCTDNDGVKGIGMFVDYNNDGDANDDCTTNSWGLDESMLIFTAASASGTSNDPIDGWNELELIEHEGKKFLMIQNWLRQGGWSDRTTAGIHVIEIQDNGSYVDGSFHTIVRGTDIGSSTWTGWGFETLSQWDEIEFDADPIPEPGTLLLIGTGVLGTLGYIRRRRMS